MQNRENGGLGDGASARDRLISAAAWAFQWLDQRSKLVILTLHRVGGESPVTAEHLAHHLAYLRDHYDVLLPTELLAARTLPRRVAMVTVDDCHDCLYRELFPVARSLKVPLAVCVPTNFVFRGKWLWFNRLAWIAAHAPKAVARSIDQQVHELKRLTPRERDAAIDGLAAAWGVTAPETPTAEFRPSSVDQLKEMQATGLVEICSHTVSHPIVSRLDDAELATELSQSKSELEAVFGVPVSTFCYPNGEAGDFDERTRRAVKDAGYKMAFTSVEGVNRMARMDWLALRRVHAHPRRAVFAKLASGLGDVQQSLFGARTARGRAIHNGIGTTQ